MLPDDATPGMFGADLRPWLTMGFGRSNTTRLELQPFTEGTPLLPHDDVSVFIIARDLVFIALWESGKVTGMYYAIDLPDAGDDGEGGDTRAPDPSKEGIKEAICNRLLRTCMDDEDPNWILACAAWLYFCMDE